MRPGMRRCGAPFHLSVGKLKACLQLRISAMERISPFRRRFARHGRPSRRGPEWPSHVHCVQYEAGSFR